MTSASRARWGIVRRLAMAVALGAVLVSPTLAQTGSREPAAAYGEFVLRSCDEVAARVPDLTALAEQLAERLLAGGVIGVIWEPPSATGPQGPQYEIRGRSGGLVALDVRLDKRFAEADRAKDVAIVGWQRAPAPGELDILNRYREHYFILAFGPRALPELAEYVPLCDAWIDTGLDADDRVVTLPGGTRAGRGNCLVNALNAWALQAELVAALTRRGKMPTLLKSHAWADSAEWNGRYRGKLVFHDDLQVAPVAPGVLSRQYLDRIRGLTNAFIATQLPAVARAADLIVAELAQGRQTVVAQSGHTTYERIGKYEDAAWATPVVLYNTAGRIRQYRELTADGALVLRVGYSGEEAKLMELLREKQQRVIMVAIPRDPRPDHQLPADLLALIDPGWEFGDACVQIPGYPIRVFPPSGVMQLLIYDTIDVEVQTRLAVAAGGGATAPAAPTP